MQPREKLVLEFWDRRKELNVKNKKYRDFINELFGLLLKNDININDMTTHSLIDEKNISAQIVGKENGIIAGLEEFSTLNNDLKLKFMKKDGDRIRDNDVIIEINGNARKILERERTSLNLLQRMSGIATLTDSLNKKLGEKIKIAATRKTLWGFADKKGVSIGNGLTHRLSLNDGILIKDNHLKLLGYDFNKAINLAKSSSKYIEMEVEDKKQALKAAVAARNSIKKSKNKNLFAIMLDKIKPSDIKSAINELKGKNLYEGILLEASGNINTDNIMEYKDCGVDIISMGSLTNSAKVLNMSLEVK